MGCTQNYTFMMTNDIKCQNSTSHRCIKDDSSYSNKLFHCKNPLGLVLLAYLHALMIISR